MINIPDEIKKLLQQNSVEKNFRVRFPNGEHEDITNVNIVGETVSFKESICSQNELKFGLCESPYIEFETIGIGKIKGYEIECYIEVLCDDSISGSVYKEDLQTYVYPIPLGRFVIDSCRKQADMTHRRIVAYALNIQNWEQFLFFNRFLKQKFLWSINNLKVNPEMFLLLLRPDACNFVESAIMRSGTRTSSTAQYKYKMDYKTYSLRSPYITIAKWKYNNEFIEIAKGNFYFKNLIALYSSIDFNFNNLMFESGANTYSSSKNYFELFNAFELMNKTVVFPYGRIEATESSTTDYYSYVSESISIPTRLYIEDLQGNIIYDSGTYDNKLLVNTEQVSLFDSSSAYAITVPTKSRSMVFKNVTGSGTTTKTVFEYDFSDILQKSIVDYAEAYCELQGKFGKTNREGKIELFSLKNKFNALYPSETLYPSVTLYPSANIGINVNRSNYETVWYDDDETLPFGSASCTYNDGNDELFSKVYGNGFAEEKGIVNVTYDISNNLFIKNNVFTQTQIENILNTIASNICGFTYMPSEVTMIGRPDLESGDVLEIKTNEETIKTIVLQRTLSGIQSLTDSITSD